jgi:hypothetical protein
MYRSIQNGDCSTAMLNENSMKMLSHFVAEPTSLIVAVLSCFDRAIVN